MTPKEILKTYWGHDSFRPLQEEIINSILDGRDALAVLPTGGGKSICFQVPALSKPGCCLVISPLIALMEDQVQNLRNMNIPAAAIVSGISHHEISEILRAGLDDELKFIYVSPERLEARSFVERISQLPINLIAVDEAHCISQWGYDFRPSYLNIAKIREQFEKVPLIALTASATELVKKDIIEKLGMEKGETFMTSFNRKNLIYQAEFCLDKINRIKSILDTVNGSGIIYCKTRRKTKELSDLLNQLGINCDYYHAGLSQEARKEKQEKWIIGTTRIMICTNAFGMGIDKSNVRLVVHADIPDCLENYYQEAGRAGRDGNEAYPILLYNENELAELKNQPSSRFPEIKTIRIVYQALANYFQIPTGLGANESFDFNLEDFIKKFKLNLNEVIYSLQALKQERIISFMEQVFKPSLIQFTSTKSDLNEFEKNNPISEEVVKCLLRTYSGIFDIPVRVDEMQLSNILKMNYTFLITQLEFLNKNNIIEYSPRRETPQIVYLQNRVKTEELNLNYENYLKRKKQFIERINAMINYCNSQTCRSTYIGNYFGDLTIVECGKCDNCTRKTKQPIQSDQFTTIYTKINALLLREHLDIKVLEEKMDTKKEELYQVLEEMKKEEKIGIDHSGKLFLK